MNKDMLAFLKGVLTVAVLLLLSTPLILMNVFQGDLSGPWIGFWGSFAGGILGTVGVIYVAHLQNKEQVKRMEILEWNEKERLKVTVYVDKLEVYYKDLTSYINIIDDLYYETPKLYKDLLFYIRITEKSDRGFSKSEIETTLERMAYLKDKSDNIIKRFTELSQQERLLLESGIMSNGFLKSQNYVRQASNTIRIVTILLDDIKDGIDYEALKFHVKTMEQLLKDDVIKIYVHDTDDKYYIEDTFRSFYNLHENLLNAQDNLMKNIVTYIDKLN